jgi:hypothetical protein
VLELEELLLELEELLELDDEEGRDELLLSDGALELLKTLLADGELLLD